MTWRAIKKVKSEGIRSFIKKSEIECFIFICDHQHSSGFFSAWVFFGNDSPNDSGMIDQIHKCNTNVHHIIWPILI